MKVKIYWYFKLSQRKNTEFKLLKKKNMCIVNNMYVVVTRSPFEAAKSEVDVSEAM